MNFLPKVLVDLIQRGAEVRPPLKHREATVPSKFFLSDDQLAKFAPRAVNFSNGLNMCVDKYEINTPSRAAAFLGQLHIESGGFRHVRELWGPSEWQKRYEGHKGLGNTEPGDGFRFRGRGLIQMTGRKNNKEVSLALFGDARLLDKPELLELPDNAALSAGWYFYRHGLNSLADKWEIDKITRAINGAGMLHKEERRKQCEKARALLS